LNAAINTTVTGWQTASKLKTIITAIIIASNYSVDTVINSDRGHLSANKSTSITV